MYGFFTGEATAVMRAKQSTHACAASRLALTIAFRAKGMAVFERFTDRARRVVVLAQEEARMLNHDYVGTEHILLGLIHEGEGEATKALEALGISPEDLRKQVEEIIGQGQQALSGQIPFTLGARKVLELALCEALQLKDDLVNTEHILAGLIGEGEGVAAHVLVGLGVDLTVLHQQVLNGHLHQRPHQPSRVPSPNRTFRGPSFVPILDDIALPVRTAGETFPFMRRVKDLDLAIQILTRPLKNNPMLVSESRAAIAALLDEIVAGYIDGDYPAGDPSKKRLCRINSSALKLGTDSFDDNLARVTKEAQARPEVILYIEDIHDLLTIGKDQAGSSAIIAFRTALHRRRMQVIGSTTPALYQKQLATDDFARRNFQVIHLQNMDATEAAVFLTGGQHKLQDYLGMSITDQALQAAAGLALYFTQSHTTSPVAAELQHYIDAETAAVALLESSVPKLLKSSLSSASADDLQAKINEIWAAKTAAPDHPGFESVETLREAEEELEQKLRQIPHHLDEDSVITAAAAIFSNGAAELRRLIDNPPTITIETCAGITIEEPIRQAIDHLKRRLFTGITNEARRVLTALALHVGWDSGTIKIPTKMLSRIGALSGSFLNEIGEPDRRTIGTAEALINLAPQHTALNDLNAQIVQIRAAKEAAIDDQDFERASELRDTEKRLLGQVSRVAVDDTAVFVAASVISGISIADLRQLVDEFTLAIERDAGDALLESYTLLNDEPLESARGDLLGTDSVASGIASLLASSRSETPFVLAVDASWGMGKSTLLRQIELRMGSFSGVETIRFNAWTAKDASALEGLIKSVLVELDPNVVRRWARKISGKRRTFTLAGIGFSLAARFIGVTRLVDDLWAQLAVDARSRNQFRDVIRGMLSDWVEGAGQGGLRRMLVVFVDDLDRCADDAIVQICEAVKLYLDAPGLIFVFACDLSVIARGATRSQERADGTGRTYLEKIVQVVHRLPPPDEGQLIELIRGYALRSGTTALIDRTVTRILIDSAGRNPRRIKRIINSIVLENRLNPAWSLPPLSRTQLVIAILLQHLYAPFYEAYVDEAVDGDPIETFLDYAAVRSRLPILPPEGDLWWETAHRLFTQYEMPPPTRSEFRSELAEVERKLPTSFPVLISEVGLVTLLRKAGDAPARAALRAELMRHPPAAEIPIGWQYDTVQFDEPDRG